LFRTLTVRVAGSTKKSPISSVDDSSVGIEEEQALFPEAAQIQTGSPAAVPGVPEHVAANP